MAKKHYPNSHRGNLILGLIWIAILGLIALIDYIFGLNLIKH